MVSSSLVWSTILVMYFGSVVCGTCQEYSGYSGWIAPNPYQSYLTTWAQADMICKQLGKELPDAKTQLKYWAPEIHAEKRARSPSIYMLWTREECTYMQYIDTNVELFNNNCTKEAYFQCKQ